MIIARTKKELNRYLNLVRSADKTIGFVPTMGALHNGHLSLIKCSNNENNFTLVSIFVNPTQFNNPDDLKNYPRNEDVDLDLLLHASCDIVFIPGVDEMYGEKDTRVFDFNGIDKVMEGKYRDGHFNGVAQIVSKLFETVRPNKAYFGKKDFQQVAIVNYLNKHYLPHLAVEIVSCDIIREEDGLAMSSRNRLLKPLQRKSAALISETLKKYAVNFSGYTIEELKNKITEEIDADKNLETEYVDIVDDETLQTVSKIIPGRTTICVAVYAGKVRLIDNFSIKK